MIKEALARKFIEQVVQYTDYNINIMNEQGIIIASRNPKRVGSFHEIAYRIIRGEADIVEITEDDNYPGVLPGINMAIKVDNRCEGIVGITGNPREIKSIALVIKMAIEAMVKYESWQKEQMYHRNRKDQFMYMLTDERYSRSEELRRRAKQLYYSEDYVRIPILLQTGDTNAEEWLEVLKSNSIHGKEDISFVLSDSEILVFKVLSMEEKSLFAGYKYYLEEYLGALLKGLGEQEREYCVYAGSFQNSFSQYCYAYRHCRWLEDKVREGGTIHYFYDHSNDYLMEVTPVNELQRMYQVYGGGVEEEFIQNFLEIEEALIKTNYNLTAASRELYMHKNTVTYRFNKIKEELNVNPMVSARDRFFMEGLYSYFKKMPQKR